MRVNLRCDGAEVAGDTCVILSILGANVHARSRERDHIMDKLRVDGSPEPLNGQRAPWLIHDTCAIMPRLTTSQRSLSRSCCHNGVSTSKSMATLHSRIQLGLPSTKSMSPVTTAETEKSSRIRRNAAV